MENNIEECFAKGRTLLDRLVQLPRRVGFREFRNTIAMPDDSGENCCLFREFVLPDFKKSLILACVLKKHPEQGFSPDNYHYRIITGGRGDFPHGEDNGLQFICTAFPGHALDVMKDVVCACAGMLEEIGLARKGSSVEFDLASEVVALEITFPLLTGLYKDLENLNLRLQPVKCGHPFVFREDAGGQEVSVYLTAGRSVAIDTSKAGKDFPRRSVAGKYELMWYRRREIISEPARPGDFFSHLRHLRKLKVQPSSSGLTGY